jgi:tripartite-type tricarboxylate transporter receptor subunit TctC
VAEDKAVQHSCTRIGHAVTAAASLAFVALALVALDATAQSLRAIKIVVPYPPGGGIDVLARIMADEISRTQAGTIVIDNHPGAGTVIATESVSRANPDGNTILIVNNTFLVAPHLHKLNYDPLTSFEPIARVAITPTVIVVRNDSPYRDLGQLLAAARLKPGELTIASAPGASLQLGFERLQQAASVRLTFVPYPGTTPAVSAVLGGHVVSAIADYPAAAGQLQAGTVRALATGSPQRIEWLPNVPAVAESGFPGYDVQLWYGFVAPAKTQGTVVAQLAELFTTAAASPAIKARLAAQGIKPEIMNGREFAAALRKQYAEYGAIIRSANMKAE